MTVSMSSVIAYILTYSEKVERPGEMAERPNALALKARGCNSPVGSNPTLSATMDNNYSLGQITLDELFALANARCEQIVLDVSMEDSTGVVVIGGAVFLLNDPEHVAVLKAAVTDPWNL